MWGTALQKCKADDKFLSFRERKGGWYDLSLICGDSQNQAGHNPEQPAVGDPACAGRVGLDDLQRSLSTSAILQIYAI